MGENESSPPPGLPVATHAFVRFSIILTTVLFLIAIAAVGYRSIVTSEPSAFLVIDGSLALAGAEVDVQSVDMPTHFKGIFGADDRFNLVFFVEPGVYTVRIAKDGDNVLPPQEVTIPQRQGMRIDLTKFGNAIATTRAAP